MQELEHMKNKEQDETQKEADKIIIENNIKYSTNIDKPDHSNPNRVLNKYMVKINGKDYAVEF